MLYNHDFERMSHTYLGDAETIGKGSIDPGSAPRGMVVGIAIALGIWGSAIIAFIALR